MPFYKILLVCSLLVAQKSFAQNSPAPSPLQKDSAAFDKVEVEASFPGGAEGWKNFLIKNLNPNAPVKNGAPAGIFMVIVRFIVSKDGSISDVVPETSLGYGMEEEVVKLLKKSGKWNPATQNAKAVNAYRRQPVTFMVQDESFEIESRYPYQFFAGMDNKITISVNKVKDSDLTVSVSKGTIKALGDGGYVVRTQETGRVLLSIYNNKKNKPVGSASFVVLTK
jgi:GldM C-terminal domain/Gram-negative bacterial TonB protein C-terminal